MLANVNVYILYNYYKKRVVNFQFYGKIIKEH